VIISTSFVHIEVIILILEVMGNFFYSFGATIDYGYGHMLGFS
jgi:hypothetical protein